MSIDDFSAAELRAIATRALAGGADYSRELLREQLLAEEFAEGAAGTDPLPPPTLNR